MAAFHDWNFSITRAKVNHVTTVSMVTKRRTKFRAESSKRCSQEMWQQEGTFGAILTKGKYREELHAFAYNLVESFNGACHLILYTR